MTFLRGFCLTLCLLLFPQVGITAPSVLQSGEHGRFTRLVASFPERVTWRAEKSGGKVILTLEGHDEGFDTTGVYNRITRDRIAGLSQDGNTLTLALGCDCNVAAFAVGAQYVAIDILDKDVETALPLLRETDDTQAHAVKVATADASQPRKIPDAPKALPDLAPVTQRPHAPLSREAPSDQELELLIEVQTQLAQEIGSAATRGILQGAGPFHPRKALPLQKETSSLDDHLENQTILPEDLPDAVRNMRISNSMDGPDSANTIRNRLSATGALCPQEDEVGIGTWSGDTDFNTEIGTARARLFGEFDRLDTAVALRLARTYIYHGFGAEARQILMLDPALARENRILIGISEILEEGRTSDSAYFRSMLACKTDIALWSFLAKERFDFAGSLDPAPALLALNRLPVHLRRFLAPELSKRLLEYGDSEAASLALRSVERLPEPLSTAGRFAQAEVNLDAGQTDQAKTQLEDVIDDNSAQSPRALIALVNAQLRDNQPISHDTAGLIEAYAQELRETDLGPELQRAHVLALAKSGQFDRAFAATRALGGDQEDTASGSLRALLLKETAETADDLVFLDHMFRQTEEHIAKVPLTTKLKIAERYLALGFGHAAQSVVEMIPENPRNRTRQVLAARISLSLERPAMARAALLGIEGAQEDLLRAQAQRMSGALEEAHRLFMLAERPQEAVKTAWLANDWQSLTPEETPVFGPVAMVAAEPAEPDPEYEGMLARSSDALQESVNARRVLSEMLQAPELQIDLQEQAE